MSAEQNLETVKQLMASGQLEQAERLLQRLLEVQADNPELQLQRALCLVHMQRLDEALAQLDALEKRYGPVPPVAINRGEVLRRLGRFDESIAALSQLLKQQPQFAMARFNLALALRGAGQLTAAVAEYRQALAQQNDNGDGWFNLGNALFDLGQVDDAIDSYQQALKFIAEPGRAKVLNNLGSAYLIQRHPQQAIKPLQQALSLKPDYVEAQLNLAKSWSRVGDIQQARLALQRVSQLQPQQWWHGLHADNLCPDVYASNQLLDQWRDDFGRAIDRWREHPGQLPLEQLHLSGAEPTYKLMYQGREDRSLKVAYAQMLASKLPQFEAPTKRAGADRLRIGMVVSQGHEGIFARSLKGMLPHFDRRRFDIVIAVSRPALAATQAMLPFDSLRWLALPGRVDQAAEQLRQAQLDLLYHWEVGTDSFNYFLPWFRCAPVQYTSWAWPMTTGIPAMDFFLTSDLVEPDNAQRLYSEPLLSMKSNMFTWAEPATLSNRSWKGADFGFNDQENLYLCHQNPRKVHPDFDALVAQILERDPLGRLLLIGGAESNEAHLLQQRLQRTLGALAERVTIMPRMPNDQYLGLLQCVDVALDPPHYTGANTSFDAFGLGLPVITQRSVLLRGNFTSGLYQQMAFTDLIAESAEHYVDLALRVAQDGEYRAHCWQRLMNGRERIFHDSQAVSELESAWQRMAGF